MHLCIFVRPYKRKEIKAVMKAVIIIPEQN